MWRWMCYSFHSNKKQLQQILVSLAAGQEPVILGAITKTYSFTSWNTIWNINAFSEKVAFTDEFNSGKYDHALIITISIQFFYSGPISLLFLLLACPGSVTLKDNRDWRTCAVVADFAPKSCWWSVACSLSWQNSPDLGRDAVILYLQAQTRSRRKSNTSLRHASALP